MNRTLMVAVVSALLTTGCGFNYSDGVRAGVVTKFSKKGVFCKTWEGELALGGFRRSEDESGGASFVANLWEFTVGEVNEGTVDQIQRALESGERVQLRYHQTIVNNPCATDTGYWVSAVEHR